LLGGMLGGGGGGIAGRVAGILGAFLGGRGNKRSLEQTDVAPTIGITPTRPISNRGYGTVAENLINQVQKHFQVTNPEVQQLIESICDANPITKLAPTTERLYMVALGECELIGTESHVSEQWIRLHHMQHKRHVFEPICPKKSCCNVSEMVNIGLLCPGGGVAHPVCGTNCKWSYDCKNKTIIDRQPTAQPPVAATAHSDDDFFSAFLEEENALESNAARASSDFSENFAMVVDPLDTVGYQAEAQAETENSFFARFSSNADGTSKTLGVLTIVVIALPVVAITILLVIVVRMARHQ